jgi:hypothetical protein
VFDFSCLLACPAMAASMEYVGQYTDTSHVNTAKYFPLVAMVVIIYFLFFHKKKK